MKQLFTLALAFAVTLFTHAQDMDSYNGHIEKAEQYYKNEQYQESAEEYQAAHDVLGGKSVPDDRYAAAKAFAMAGQEEKALFHLRYMAEHPKMKFKEVEELQEAEAFDSLKSSNDWKEVLELVQANKAEYEKYLDKPLADKLAKIQELDQKYRIEAEKAAEEFGPTSKEVMKYAGLMAEQDAKNLVVIEKILEERGWLGPKVIGIEGARTLFLVIQHADLETQIKYLPMMREAVARNEAEGSQLALLEDRINMRQGKRQVFGSQIGVDQKTGEYYVYPLMDPDKVDEYRASVGLPPLAEYVKIWGMTWDKAKHIERTKQIEAEQAKTKKD